MISLYSLIWTFLISCPMCFLIFILRRRSDYLTRYGVTFVLILYIFCIVRMLVPIEFPGYQRVLRDPYVFAHIMKVYAGLGPAWRRIVLHMILWIWIGGMCGALLYNLRRWNKAAATVMEECFESDGRAERILAGIDAECGIRIQYSMSITEPFIRGLLQPTIYLPEKECNDRELEFILMHEYIHWKRKDLWKKFFLNIVNIIFWWNPLAYLLCNDLSQIIELACDNAMSKRYSELELLDYLDTLTYMAGGRRKNFDTISTDALGFISKLEKKSLRQRFQYVMFKKENKKLQKRANIFILCFCFLWMTASYYFILQPDYRKPDTGRQQKNMHFVSDDTNSYLEELKDGSYLFHYSGFTDKVSKEDVDSGMYEIYPVIKYKSK